MIWLDNLKKEFNEQPLDVTWAFGRILIAIGFIYLIVVIAWPPGWSTALQYHGFQAVVQQALACSANGSWLPIQTDGQGTFNISKCEKVIENGNPFVGNRNSNFSTR